MNSVIEFLDVVGRRRTDRLSFQVLVLMIQSYAIVIQYELSVCEFISFFVVILTAIPYTVKVTTGSEKSMGTDSNVYIKVIGTKKRHTGKQFLELMQKIAFMPGSVETFSLEAIDVGEVKQIEVMYCMVLSRS